MSKFKDFIFRMLLFVGILSVLAGIYSTDIDFTLMGMMSLIMSHLNDIENKLDKRTKED